MEYYYIIWQTCHFSKINCFKLYIPALLLLPNAVVLNYFVMPPKGTYIFLHPLTPELKYY